MHSSRLRHQYGIFGIKSQTSFSGNATRAGNEEGPAVFASYFRPHSPFRARFPAGETLARERKATLAKRYRKSMGTRSRMYHRYSIYNIRPVLTSNSTPPQYNYFLLDKKVKIIMPELLKTGLAKIRTHSTTWQLKTIKFVQRPIKKPTSDAGH